MPAVAASPARAAALRPAAAAPETAETVHPSELNKSDKCEHHRRSAYRHMLLFLLLRNRR